MALDSEIFSALASRSLSERVKAGAKLIKSIESQKELQYVLKRLVRGLNSCREDSRIGFSSALTEILNADFDISADEFLKLIDEQTNTKESANGQELRDVIFGRMFGLQVLIASNMLYNSTDDSIKDKLLSFIIKFSQVKPWCRELSGHLICSWLQNASKRIPNGEVPLDEQKLFTCFNVPESAEGIAIALVLKKLYPEKSSIALFEGDLSMMRSYDLLRQTLTGSFSNQEKQSNVNWSPRIHFVWDVLFELFKEKKKPCSTFHKIWEDVVDGGFFAKQASVERKFSGFKVMEKALDDIPQIAIPIVFSKNLMHCLLNHLAEKERYLHNISKKMTTKLQKIAENDQKLADLIFRELTSNNGTIWFDKKTRTKTLDKIQKFVSLQETLRALETYQYKFLHLDDTGGESIQKSNRQYLLEAMNNIFKAHVSRSNEDLNVKHLSFLCKYGFITDGMKLEIPIESEMQALIRTKLFTSLLNLSFKSKDQTSEDSEASFTWLQKSFEIIEEETASDNKALIQIDKQTRKTISNALKLTNDLQRRYEDSRDTQAASIVSLIYLALIQVYAGDAEAISVLDDFIVCSAKLFNASQKDESKGKSTEVLVDVLLFILSKENLLLRKACNAVFEAFTPHMTEKALELLYTVLFSNDNPSEDLDLFEVDSDTVSDTEVVTNTNNISSEPIKPEADLIGDNKSQNSVGTLKREHPEAPGENRRSKVVKKEEDGSSQDDENADINLDDVDEEEMEDFDQKVAEVLRLQNSVHRKKKDKKKLETQTISFKLKVLELLEEFISTQSANEICISLCVPLLKAAEINKSPQVRNKLDNLMRNKLSKCRPAIKKMKIKDVYHILKKVHAECMRGGDGSFISSASHLSLFLTRTIGLVDPNMLKKVFKLYEKMLTQYTLDRKLRINASVFIDMINWATQWRRSHT